MGTLGGASTEAQLPPGEQEEAGGTGLCTETLRQTPSSESQQTALHGELMVGLTAAPHTEDGKSSSSQEKPLYPECALKQIKWKSKKHTERSWKGNLFINSEVKLGFSAWRQDSTGCCILSREVRSNISHCYSYSNNLNGQILKSPLTVSETCTYF